MSSVNSKKFLKIQILALLLFPSLLMAQQEKDWNFAKRMDAGLGVMACVSTTAVAESSIPVQAEIILPENDERGPLLIIKAKGLAGQIAKAYVRPDSKTAYAMLLLNSDSATGEDTFVLSPLRLPEVLKIIIEKTKLDVYFGEGATSILARISLKGSSVTLNRAAACRTSKALLSQALFNELKTDANLVEAQAGTLEEMLIAYQETVTQLNLRAKIKLELAASQQQAASLKKQLDAAEAALAVAVRNEQTTILEIDNIKKKIASLQASLQKAQQDLPGLQSQKISATDQVAKAQAAVDPHLPEINRLQREIDIAESELSTAQATVSRLESEISSLQRQISALETQTDQLRSEQNTKRREIDSLKTDRQRLENEYRLFDVQRRSEEILRNDFSYQNEKRDLDRNIQKRQQLPSEIEFARSRAMEANAALRACQAQTPPVDCSAQANNAQRFQREFEAKRNELQSIERDIERNRDRMRSSEQEADREARDERDQLLTRINRLATEIANLENQINEYDRRIRDIQTIEIPRLSRQLDSARVQLGNAQSIVSSAAQNVRRAEASLERYKQSVGYDALALKLREAKAVLRDINSKITEAEKTIQGAPGQITAAQQSLVASQQELSRREQVRLSAESTAQTARNELQKHLGQQDGIQVRLTAADAALLAARKKAQSVSKSLFGY